MSQHTHTIPSREEILGIFRSAKAPLDTDALARALDVNPESTDVLLRRLNAMARDGQLQPGVDGMFALAEQPGFIAGRVSSHRDGFGFVIPDDAGDDLFLSERKCKKSCMATKCWHA